MARAADPLSIPRSAILPPPGLSSRPTLLGRAPSARPAHSRSRARRYEFVRDTLDSWFTAASPDSPHAVVEGVHHGGRSMHAVPASNVSPSPNKKLLALLPDTGVPLDARGVYLPHCSHVSAARARTMAAQAP